jgi:hypothetical protein
LIIGVRFKQSNGGWSDKIYDFSIDCISHILYGSSSTYNIKTSDGYTYRDAEVYFIPREPDPHPDREQGLKKIIAVRKLFGGCDYWFDTTIISVPNCSTSYSTYAVSDLQTCFASTSSSAEQAGTALKESIQRLAGFGTINADNLKAETNKINIKGDNNMFNFEFGKANNTGAGFSMYGLTFSTDDNSYIAYKDGGWVDVPKEFIIKGMSDMLYMMPVAKTAVKANDYIRHNGHWVRVIEVTETTLKAEDIFNKTVIEILPTRSPFGFDFYTKLVNMFDGFGGEAKASAENPFGNMWMFVLMGDSKSNFKDMLPFMMMSGGDFKFDMSNPMMMYFLLNK